MRAATSLARLQPYLGDQAAARRTLDPVYARFNEGLDTADLREARAALESTVSMA